MKKSTRLLALLLCVVMVAALLPAFALADGSFYGGATTPGGASGVNWHDKGSLNAPYLQLSKTRVTNGRSGANFQVTIEVNRYDLRYESKTGGVDLNDWGYGDKNIFLIPVGPGTNPGTTTFTLRRNQDASGNNGTEDINRWWRWANENDPAGFHTNNDGYTAADPGIDGVDAVVICEAGKYNGIRVDTEQTTIPKSGAGGRDQNNYFFDKRWTFEWTGGNRQRSEKAKVTINRSELELGESTVLWSANGTDVNHQFSYAFLDLWFIGNNGILKGREVWNGDTSKHTIAAAEAREVVYDYNYDGCPAPEGYIVWTTGKASTSQKHKIIGAPSREGFIFEGWLCIEGENAIKGKYFLHGQDLNNGITQNVVLQAQWKEIIIAPDYYVSFDGNNNTNTDVHMDNQGFHFDKADTLSKNMYEQVFTVNYNANGGMCDEASANAVSDFLGWGTSANSGAVYTDKESVVNLTDVAGATVPLFAQWQQGSVVLPTPSREPADTETDVAAYLFDGWYTKLDDSGSFVGMGGDTYYPGGNVTIYAHWKKVTEDSFYVYHSSTGKTDVVSLSGLVERNTYQYKEPSDNKYYDISYITGYTSDTYDITKDVNEGYLYGGTFEDGSYTTPADYRGKYNSVKTKHVALHGDNVVDTVTEVYTAAGTPTGFNPQAGKTYYLWEVPEQHLQPTILGVWDKDGSNYNVIKAYAVAAVDRLEYKEAGFLVDGDKYVSKVGENNALFSTIDVKSSKSSGARTFDYNKLNPKYTDVKSDALISCAEIDLPTKENESKTVVPYWITLDDQIVYGVKQATVTYNGAGTGYQNMALTVSFQNYPVVTNKMAPARSTAPMMLMSTYSMNMDAVATPEEEPEIKAMLKVVDGNDSYEVEITEDAVALTPAGQDGKLFGGWFTDKACTKAADLNAVEDGDTVYAKYVSDKYLQVKYNAVFTLLSKSVSLTSAVDSKDYAETGYVITTKSGEKTVVVTDYASKFALQNANQLFGVEKNAPLMNVDYKLSGLSKNDKITVTPYLVTADGTTVYGTARTLTYTGLTMRG